MTSINFVKKTDSGNMRCEIIIDKNNCLGGNKRGNRNFVVRHNNGKGYRVNSMLDTYKALKADGYNLDYIF